MSQKGYKIVTLEKLLAARSAAEIAEDEAREAKKRAAALESVTAATFEGEPTTAIPKLEPKAPPAANPSHSGNGGNGNGDMPKSLEGISALDLSLLDLDGMLTGEEQVWYNKRKMKALGRDRHRTPGPNDWMGM